MKSKKKREELYKIETTIKEKGKEEYIKYVHRDKKKMIIGVISSVIEFILLDMDYFQQQKIL